MITVKMLKTIANNVVCTYSHGDIVTVTFSIGKVWYECQYDSGSVGLYGFNVTNPMQLFFPEQVKEK